MQESALKLIVPQSPAIREEIREKTELFFSGRDILPPVSFDGLSKYAAELTETNGWGHEYLAFVMVCCGNAIWRQIVEVVPFNRRILLLPECLKNSSKCRAGNDGLGLLCADCGSCSISGLLQFAENLGYVALVTEGTTVTTRLIESGKVDAVIGVGCLDVLQKLFFSVTKYAVPGIGIPLLRNGCKDTEVDIRWLKQEISRFKKNDAIKLVNMNHLKKRITSFFSDEQLTLIAGPANTTTEKIAREALTSVGHRWRPFLTVLAYESFSENPDDSVSQQLAVAVECFHKASLVHDDIEDNDRHRNGQETIHSRYGIPVALNAGDLLIGEGYRLIAESRLPPETKNRCLKIAASGHAALSIGQGEELLSANGKTILPAEKIFEIFQHKTSAAFEVSLTMGAVAGGAGENSLQMLKNFSRNIGIAYQIKDDLDDFKGINGDVASRKFSVLLSLLAEALPEEKKQELFQNSNAGSFTEIFGMIEEYGISGQTEELLKDYINEAFNCLENLSNIGLKLALFEILGTIFNEYI